MAKQQGSDLDFGKSSKALNLVLHTGNTATIDAVLTVLGMLGYDTTTKRIKSTDGTTIVQYLVTADVQTASDLGGGSPSTTLPASQASIKAYVDAVVASGAQPFSDFDAGSATNFPSGTTLQSRFRVSVAGTVHGITLAVGDTFFPKVASPSVSTPSDWVFVQANVDAASSSVLGLVKLVANLSELTTNAGGDANDVVTVAIFNEYEAAKPRIRNYTTTTNIASGSNGITHSLNTSNVINVTARDANGPIDFDWTVTNANAVNINASKAYNSTTINVTAI